MMEKPPTSPIEKRQNTKRQTSISGSAESFSRTRTKFLNAPIPKQNQNVTFSLKKDKQSKKVKNKKKQLNKESFNPLEDEEKEKKRLQEIQECFDISKTQKEAYSNLKSLLLKHMQVLDDLTKLRNHYYHVYLSALTDKVEQQRRNIKKSTERVQRKLKEKEKKQQAQLARRKYERAATPEDDTFNIKELFKSHWYNVLIMEDKMKKEGKLRTIEDYDKFWEDILRPGIGGGNVDDGSSYYISKASLGHESHTASLASLYMVDSQPILPRELSFIREDTELSKSQSAKRKTSAKKQLQKLSSSASFLSAPVKGRRQDVHPKALQLDQTYPKTEMPHLRMFDMDLEPPKEDPEVVQMREEFGARARIRNHKRKTIMNMHEMSLTHQAATSRIFLNHSKLMARLEGPDINDVTSSARSQDYPVDSQTSTPSTTLPAINWSTSYQYQQEMPQFYNEVTEERPESDDERVQEQLTSSRGSSCRSSQESYHITDTTRERRDCKQRASPIPLTLGSIQDQCNIKEAKCPSTLWTNYGKELPAIT